MIVCDASAMVQVLVATEPPPELLDALAGDLHAPSLLDVETVSVLRGLELGRMLPPERAVEALHDFWSFTIVRHELATLRGRVWELRHQFTTYDAFYIALAEGLGAPLITCDRKLATRGHQAEVVVFAPRD